ncbi:translocase of chloroplast 120, chloroplastic-like [Heracleum sosnowskyi]|uniref:Translocase of chloroplast 120, chloroplastic-like n=1 Tax=Heracleum sosnowskyi TaxID=360622 RepID=A0AAD8J1K5_9APIA|nr:translocase of chloroplast 120, chloroplastic-like [Heracleum sosnowskyi]
MENKGFGNEDCDLRVDVGGLNGSERVDFFVAGVGSGDSRGDLGEAGVDGMGGGNELGGFEKAEEDVSVGEGDGRGGIGDDGVDKEADSTGGVVDNGKDGGVYDSVDASVSEYGVAGSGDSNVVIEGMESGYDFLDNQKAGQSMVLEASSEQEPQLDREFGEVDGSGEGEGAQCQVSESKEEISCETDKILKINESNGESITNTQDDMNGDLSDVLDGTQYDENAEMVKESVDVSNGDGAESDDEIAVKRSGVALQNWQNGVSFSKVLNSNGFEGGGHDSQLREPDSILNQNDKSIELNAKTATVSSTHQDDKTVDPEDVSARSLSGQQADEIETPCNELGNVDMELLTDTTSGLDENQTARLGADAKVPAKELFVSELKRYEESSILDDNICTSVKENSQTLEVNITPSPEVSLKEDAKADGATSHVAKSLNHSVTSQKSLSVENSNSVAGKIEREASNTEQRKQTTGDTKGSETRSVATPSPAGLGRAAPLLEPSSRVVSQTRVNGTGSHMHNQVTEESANGDAEENDETREKLQMIRVKFLRLAHRLGQTPHNVVVAQVLYRLGLAEQLRGGNGGRGATFSFDRASAMAEQLESTGQEPLDFSCTIMVLGKSGVGKSATINSIFDQVMFNTDAFKSGTKKVQDVVGTVQGIKVRVIDTPGLLPSWSDQHRNEKILESVRRFIKKSPPDIVLYLDRLDMQSRDSGDMPLLRTITDTFGPSIWFNAIVVLTHAASAPPEGPNGVPTGYDMFLTQRSHVVQQAIRHAAGDQRLMNPVSLVENHSACRTNRAGQRVLPNGQVWKPHLLLLSFASKILAEANTLLKLQDGPPGKSFTTRARPPPLAFLLTSLLRSRPQLKLPQEQYDDDDDMLDDDLDESINSDDESEFDKLPPFKNLTKTQLAELSKVQRRAYYDELEYREKLFMQKQLREEKQRRRMMKKMAAEANDMPTDYSDGLEETGSETSVPVSMPDLPLPASFDSDNPTHRYRFLDTTNQWLVRPVHDSHSWDHDVGYEGINMERSFAIRNKVPMSFSGQVTKDKKEAHFQMELAASVKHNEGKSTTLGLDLQQIGKDIAYTLRTDTKFSNFRRNKATASLSVTHMGDAVTAGLKVEDKLIVTRRAQIVMSGGAIAGSGDVAYGGSLEATLRDKNFPLGRFLTTLSVSLMDWHGDLATGWNAQTQIPIGRLTNLIGSVNLNNRGQGQVSIRLNSSEHLQIALVALVPLFRKLLGYPQQLQFEY